jgi:mono/diheme cytochrome c family protein
MPRRRFACPSPLPPLVLLAIVALIVPAAATVTASTGDEPPAEPRLAAEQAIEALRQQWQEVGFPLLESYCIDCHGAAFSEAELDLERFQDFQQLLSERSMMEKVSQRVGFSTMPPQDADQPSEPQRKQLVDLIERIIYGSACDQTPSPGRVTLRRLNRTEYNHTLQDLFGISFRPADDFPSDEVGAGFDNIGDVLSLSPMLVEKYLVAAEQVAQQVIIDPDTLEKTDQQRAGDSLLIDGVSETNSFYKHYLFDDAFAWAEFQLPSDGTYRIHVRGSAAVEASSPVPFGLFDERGELLSIGQLKYRPDAGGTDGWSSEQTLKQGLRRLLVAPLIPLLPTQPGDGTLSASDSGDGAPRGDQVRSDQADSDQADSDAERAPAEKATQEQAAAPPPDWEKLFPVGHYRLPGVARLTEQVIAAGRQRVGQSLSINRKIDLEASSGAVQSITVTGPTDFSDYPFPEIHRRLVGDPPKRNKQAARAARPGVEWLLWRAFRRPAESEQVEQYLNLLTSAMGEGASYHQAMQVVLTAVLVSPQFLFRVELPELEPNDQGAIPLSDFQLASRLSYFLWSSTPDERLLSLAESGSLSELGVLRGEVERMLADPRAERLAETFAAQWLGLRNLDGLQIDRERFPSFDEQLRADMQQETRLTFLWALQHNQSLLELLAGPQTFLNQRLAEHYALPGIEGEAFRPVSLRGTPRAGILTQASILTATSESTRTSPVKRGKWILENVLGTPPPDPPPGIPELEETAEHNPQLTLRQQLAVHRENPSCASCHNMMDTLGLGFENFDAVGRWRTRDGQGPVDASGQLPGGQIFSTPGELIAIIKETRGEQFARTFLTRLMTFALGRGLTFTDRCFIDPMLAASAADEYPLQELVWQVISSPPFRSFMPEEEMP